MIRFKYKNYKKQKKVRNYKELWEEAELPADEFIRRFLYHVLPSGYHRIRHYGFLSNGCKKRFRQLRTRLWESVDDQPMEKDGDIQSGIKCPKCREGILIPVLVIDGKGNILKGGIHDLIRMKKGIKNGKRLENRRDGTVETMDTS